MTQSASSPKQKRRPLYGKARQCKDQPKAFISGVRQAMALGDLTWDSWLVLSGIYAALKAQTPETEWKALWEAAKAHRLGRTQQATPLVQAFVDYEVIRDEMRKVWARETNFNAERERKRKAKDPEAYKRAAAERQRRYRERQKLQKSMPLLTAVTSADDRDEQAAAE